jgi:uncharacterized OB-fold protein
VGAGEAQPIVEGLFRPDPDGLVLLGGRSPTSGLSHFPIQPVCPYTGADDVEPIDLPRFGSLWYCTEVTAAPPGYTGKVPYGLGIVELDGGLRVVGRVVVGHRVEESPSTLRKGTPMEVVADVVPDPDGNERSTWAFAPRPDP